MGSLCHQNVTDHKFQPTKMLMVRISMKKITWGWYKLNRRGINGLNTLRLRQDVCHFTDDIFKCIFVNEIFCILIRISLKFVPRHPIDNKPLPESMLTQFTDAYTYLVHGFPSQRPVTRSFDVFFDLCLNKCLKKQSRCRWFETPLHSLTSHYHVFIVS